MTKKQVEYHHKKQHCAKDFDKLSGRGSTVATAEEGAAALIDEIQAVQVGIDCWDN